GVVEAAAQPDDIAPAQENRRNRWADVEPPGVARDMDPEGGMLADVDPANRPIDRNGDDVAIGVGDRDAEEGAARGHRALDADRVIGAAAEFGSGVAAREAGADIA